MSDDRSYGQIAYERYQYWKTGRIEPAWKELTFGQQDDWHESAYAVIDAYAKVEEARAKRMYELGLDDGVIVGAALVAWADAIRQREEERQKLRRAQSRCTWEACRCSHLDMSGSCAYWLARVPRM